MTGARRFLLSLRLRSSVVALVSGLCSAVTAQAQWPAALDSYQPPSEQELAAARWAEESFEGTEAIPGQPLTWTSAGAPFVWGEAGAATGVYQVPEDGGKLVRLAASGSGPVREVRCTWEPARLLTDAPAEGYQLAYPHWGEKQNRWVYVSFRIRFHAPDAWPAGSGVSEDMAVRPGTFLLPDGQGIGWEEVRVFPRIAEGASPNDPGFFGNPMPAAALLTRLGESPLATGWWSWTQHWRDDGRLLQDGAWHTRFSPLPRAALNLRTDGTLQAGDVAQSAWMRVVFRFDLKSFTPPGVPDGVAADGTLYLNGQRVTPLAGSDPCLPRNPFGFSLRALSAQEDSHPTLWVSPAEGAPAFRNAGGGLTALPPVTFRWRGCAGGDVDLDDFAIGWLSPVFRDWNHNGSPDNPNGTPPVPPRAFGTATQQVCGLSSSAESITDQDLDRLPDWWEQAWLPAGAVGETSNFGGNGNPDGDDYNNYEEWQNYTHPDDAAHPDHIATADRDLDGMYDVWERLHWPGTALAQVPPSRDDDDDGLSNLTEFRHGLDPRVNNRFTDVDNDGFSDAWEVYHGYHHTLGSQPAGLSDADGDGFTLRQEYDRHTDPNRYDWPTDPAALVALFSARPDPKVAPQDMLLTKVESPRAGGGQNIFLRWTTAPGIVYLVEYNAQSGVAPASAWQLLDTVEGVGGGRQVNWYVGVRQAPGVAAAAPSLARPAAFTVLRVYPTQEAGAAPLTPAFNGHLLCWTPPGADTPVTVWVPAGALWPAGDPAAGHPVLEPMPPTFTYPPVATANWTRIAPAPQQVSLVGQYYAGLPVTEEYHAADFRLQPEEINAALREIGGNWQEIWAPDIITAYLGISPAGTALPALLQYQNLTSPIVSAFTQPVTAPAISLPGAINLGYQSGGGLANAPRYFFRLRLRFQDLDQDGQWDYDEYRAGGAANAAGTSPVQAGTHSPPSRGMGAHWLTSNRASPATGQTTTTTTTTTAPTPDADDWDGDGVANEDDAVPYENKLRFAPVPESHYVAVPLTFGDGPKQGQPIPGVPVAINDLGSVLIAPEMPRNVSLAQLSQAERDARVLYLWTPGGVFTIAPPAAPDTCEMLGWVNPPHSTAVMPASTSYSLHPTENKVLAHVELRLPAASQPENESDPQRPARHAYIGGTGTFAITWTAPSADPPHPGEPVTFVKYDLHPPNDPAAGDNFTYAQFFPSTACLYASRWFADGSLLGRYLQRKSSLLHPGSATRSSTEETYQFFHCLPPGHTEPGANRYNPFSAYLPHVRGEAWDTCQFDISTISSGIPQRTETRHLWGQPQRSAGLATFHGHFLTTRQHDPGSPGGGGYTTPTLTTPTPVIGPAPQYTAPNGPWQSWAFLRDPMHIRSPLPADHSLERELLGTGSHLGQARLVPAVLNEMPFEEPTPLAPPDTGGQPPPGIQPYSTGPLVAGGHPQNGTFALQDDKVYLWPGSEAAQWEPLPLIADCPEDPANPGKSKPIYLRGSATGINNRGEIIGQQTGGHGEGWIWRNGRKHRLMDLVPADPAADKLFVRIIPTGINNSAVIAAKARLATTGVDVAVLLYPDETDLRDAVRDENVGFPFLRAYPVNSHSYAESLCR